jgi:hypothetical protein
MCACVWAPAGNRGQTSKVDRGGIRINTQCNKVHGGVGNYLPAYDSVWQCVAKYVYTHMQPSEANHPLKWYARTSPFCYPYPVGQPGRPVAK